MFPTRAEDSRDGSPAAWANRALDLVSAAVESRSVQTFASSQSASHSGGANASHSMVDGSAVEYPEPSRCPCAMLEAPRVMSP
ncbi:MAG: hypothetical protein BGO98_28475 [Myxococcales bacterium 68-20]|nr:MAG: hypothetical protein BGO98_28475 [Myxococcales bacterium 68-20]